MILCCIKAVEEVVLDVISVRRLCCAVCSALIASD